MAKKAEIQELLDAVVGKFASGKCDVCHGKGWLISNPVGYVRRGVKMGRRKAQRAGMHSTTQKPGIKKICTCAEEGYRKKVEKAVKTACRHCYKESGEVEPFPLFQVGGSGYCDHRPWHIREYVEVCRERWTG
jgi:hypothetical protein